MLNLLLLRSKNETDCAEAMKAHSEISGEKITVSYAFAHGKPEKGNQNNESKPNAKPEQKPNDNAAKKDNNKKQQEKPKAENKKAEQKPASESPKNQNKTQPGNKKEKVQAEKELSTNVIYVGQLPEHAAEDDIKKLFPKSTKVDLVAAKAKNKGVRPGFAFVTFPDDSSAAAAIKSGPTLTLKGAQLKVAYQTKRATPATA